MFPCVHRLDAGPSCFAILPSMAGYMADALVLPFVFVSCHIRCRAFGFAGRRPWQPPSMAPVVHSSNRLLRPPTMMGAAVTHALRVEAPRGPDVQNRNGCGQRKLIRKGFLGGFSSVTSQRGAHRPRTIFKQSCQVSASLSGMRLASQSTIWGGAPGTNLSKRCPGLGTNPP